MHASKGRGVRLVGAAGLSLLLSGLMGCASITQGTEQDVKVETLTKAGDAVVGAECELRNDKGSAFVRSGQQTKVRRSGANLDIQCSSPGQPRASGQAVSRSNAGLAGNILIGGGLGAAIDVGTGAAFTYPTWVRLVFGEERLYDRSGHRDNSVAAGTFVRKTAQEASAQASAANPAPGAAPVQAQPQPQVEAQTEAPLPSH